MPGGPKAGKSRLLDKFCEHYNYERKYAIKLLQSHVKPPRPLRPGLAPSPGMSPVQEVIERIWNCAEQPCGKRLAPALDLWLPQSSCCA